MLTLFASSITNKLYILQKNQCSGSTNTIRVNKQVSVDMNIPIKRATTKEKSEFDLQKINNAEAHNFGEQLPFLIIHFEILKILANNEFH